MKNKSIRKQLAALFLSGAVLLSACGQTSPDDVEAGGSQSLLEQTTEADTKAPETASETANASGVDASVYMDTSVSVEERVAALKTRLGIPLLYGVDAVHGNNNVYGATLFPHNIGLGAANDPQLMEEIGGAAEEEFLSEFGSDAHREVARRAVRESLVLLKDETLENETAIEKLSHAKNISVTGQKAYDIGSQCGGWTISWQGQAGNITQGTTIIEGLAEVRDPDVALTHSVDGSLADETDAVIAVFGEVPYAETDGDRDNGQIRISAKDAAMLEGLRGNLSSLPDGVPVVAVIIAGRPVDLTEYEDMFDAVVMAWLPGTEGAGVADVLLGKYAFSGTLKFH